MENNGTEEIVQVFRLLEKGFDVAFKVAKPSLEVMQIILKGLLTAPVALIGAKVAERQGVGNIRNVSKFLSQSSGVQVFRIKETSEGGKKGDYLKIFEKEAKRFGLQYHLLRDLNPNDGYKEIMIDNKYVSLLNYIIEKHEYFGEQYSMEEYASNATPEEKEKMDEEAKELLKEQEKEIGDRPRQSGEKEQDITKMPEISEEEKQKAVIRSQLIYQTLNGKYESISINRDNVVAIDEERGIYTVRIPGTRGKEYQQFPIEGSVWNNDTLVVNMSMNQEVTILDAHNNFIRKADPRELYGKHWDKDSARRFLAHEKYNNQKISGLGANNEIIHAPRPGKGR